MPDLLIELLSEEIPARMQPGAVEALRKGVTDGLVAAGLTYVGAKGFVTPRRLVLAVDGLTGESAATVDERKGPPLEAPETAVAGFFRGIGWAGSVEEALASLRGGSEISEGATVVSAGEVKGRPTLMARVSKPGRPAAEIAGEVLAGVVRGFPWPKSMRWGSGRLRWVRPLHSILCILNDESGAEVVPIEIDGIVAGDRTVGHRFMGSQAFSVVSLEDYEAKLRRAKVVIDPDERAEIIANEAGQLAFASGLELVEDKGLLAEVAGLVEWPVPLLGGIGAAFLDLPPEVLRTSMKEHQKFFSLTGKDGRISHFLTVANIEAPDDGAAILDGNKRVLAARLADAVFFWENDLAVAKAGMGPWKTALESVTFHAKLGSQAERVARIAALAREIAPAVGADPELAGQAAAVAKLDLASEMVYEFPELQGVMGRYYSAAAGLPEEVAAAAEAHYAPLGPSDDVPSAPVSVAVALADKLDLLTGFWAIDETPTGSKDPFALRRAALGVIRIVLENGIGLALDGLFAMANPGADGSSLLRFFHDRLKVFLRDRGIRHDVIDACIAQPGSDDLVALVARAEALQATLGTEDGENLVQGYKRAANILAQAEARDGVEYSFGADAKYMEAEEERALLAALAAAGPKIGAALAAGDYGAAMAKMAGLRGPVDAFFEAVQVNDPSEVRRRNRLNLLHQVRALCGSVADLSLLEG